MHVLICGGGVIGASIAYFLSCRGVKATVIEGTGLACAASGKSGGFLALDWCDGSPLAPLARRSFALHVGLAEEIAVVARLPTSGAAIAQRLDDRAIEPNPRDVQNAPVLIPLWYVVSTCKSRSSTISAPL